MRLGYTVYQAHCGPVLGLVLRLVRVWGLGSGYIMSLGYKAHCDTVPGFRLGLGFRVRLQWGTRCTRPIADQFQACDYG